MSIQLTKSVLSIVAIVTALTLTGQSNAAQVEVWSQGFETNTDGWLDNDDIADYGDISRVASGTGGISSNEGSYHAVVTDITAVGGSTVGPFTRFDGYRTVWPGGMTASIDVYLDTTWAAGSGFDYSVAANSILNTHVRDFVFHVAKDTSTGSLLVAGSNNTNFSVREDLESLNHAVVSNTGWYTLEHSFYEGGDGSLFVDLNLIDDMGMVLLTETRNAPADLIDTVVGGNRYGWFTAVNVPGGLAVDGHSLSVVPEPSSLALIGLASFAGIALVRRRQA